MALGTSLVAIWTYVRNADPRSKTTAIQLENGLLLKIGTYASLTNNQLSEIYSSGTNIILEEGIIPPATNAGSSEAIGNGTIVPVWQQNIYYLSGQAVLYENNFFSAKKSFESGETFKSENWNAISASGSAELKGDVTGATAATEVKTVLGGKTPASLESGVLKEAEVPLPAEAKVRIVNEYIWLQHHGVESNSGKDAAAGIRASMVLAASFNGTQGTVSCEPGVYALETTEEKTFSRFTGIFNKITANFHIPSNVSFVGPLGAKGARLSPKGLTAGQFMATIAEAEDDYTALSHFEIRTNEALPAEYKTTSKPPEAADAIFCARQGSMEYVEFLNCKFRFAQVMGGDHFHAKNCSLGSAWGAIAFLKGYATEADNQWSDCILTAAFTPIYVGKEARCQGNRFWGGHFGIGGGPAIAYKRECAAAAEGFLFGNTFFNNSVEEGGRGAIVDDEQRAYCQGNRFLYLNMGSGADGPLGGRQPGDPAQLCDAFIKCEGWYENKVEGEFLNACGYDATNGCVIKVNKFNANSFGDMTLGIQQAERYGLPVVRCTSQEDNVFETRAGNIRRSGSFRTLTSAVRRGDALRKSSKAAGNNVNSLSGWDYAKQFDTNGRVVAGYAMLSAANESTIPVIVPNPARPSTIVGRTAHLGAASTVSGDKIPAEAKGTESKSTAIVQLGTGEPVARLLHQTVLSSATIEISGLSDLAIGEATISIAGKIISYKKAEVVSGIAKLLECSGGTGEAERGIPICRAIPLESTTGFTSGVIKYGTVYCTYKGIVESGGKKYLYGVTSSGGGEIASGTTVVDQTIFKVSGPPDDYPAGPAGAACPNNNAQWAYEVFLQDKSTGPTEELQSYFAAITRTSGGNPNPTWPVVGGGLLTEEVTLPATTIKCSTTGFASTGKNKIGASSFKYTGITSTSFTGCTEGTGTFTVGQPITPISEGAIKTEQPVRGRFSSATSNENDKGLVAESSGPGDTNGYLIGSSASADQGGVVLIEI